MTAASWAQVAALAVALALSCPPLGRYLAAVHGGGPAPGDRYFGPVEEAIYRLAGLRARRPQRWLAYTASLLGFSLASTLGLYAILRLQHRLPLNPTGMGAVSPALAFNTAVSFVTGTNWQAYSGEKVMSHLSQMAGLVVAQFTAAAVGFGAALALVRGLAARGAGERVLGNFWTDLIRTIVRVLLPIAVASALLLVSQGVVQNLRGFTSAATVEGAVQLIPGGPVASQEVLKTLGTNGGGFLNANSAHPFENPNGLTNLFELYLVLLLPFAIPLMFGRLIGDRRQGRAILVVMAVLWLAPTVVGMQVEAAGNPRLAGAADEAVTAAQPGGNMEGKESRLGPAGSALLATGTMGTSAGVASSALDSYMPAGGLTALGPILLGEISPGGVGSGLYAMLVYVLLAVFIAGLMIGCTPEYLGKPITSRQMRLVALYLLVLPAVILGFSAISVLLPTALGSRLNPGPHGLTEIVYAYASAANGNGSAFAGLAADTTWYDTTLGLAMLAGRYLPIVAVLALAGAFAHAQPRPATPATLPTASPVFAALHLAVVVLFGLLTYLPMLALGLIVEQLTL